MSQYYNNVAYSLNQGPLTNIPSPSIVSKRAPTTHDLNWPIGQIWVQGVNTSGVAQNLAWALTSIINNQATWTSITGSSVPGPGVFTTLTSTGTTTLGSGSGVVNINSNADSVWQVSGAGNGLTVVSVEDQVQISAGTTMGLTSLGAYAITGGATSSISVTGASQGLNLSSRGDFTISTADIPGRIGLSAGSKSVPAASNTTDRITGNPYLGTYFFTGFSTAPGAEETFTISDFFGSIPPRNLLTAYIANSAAPGSSLRVNSFSIGWTSQLLTVVCENTGLAAWDPSDIICITVMRFA